LLDIPVFLSLNVKARKIRRRLPGRKAAGMESSEKAAERLARIFDRRHQIQTPVAVFNQIRRRSDEAPLQGGKCPG